MSPQSPNGTCASVEVALASPYVVNIGPAPAAASRPRSPRPRPALSWSSMEIFGDQQQVSGAHIGSFNRAELGQSLTYGTPPAGHSALVSGLCSRPLHCCNWQCIYTTVPYVNAYHRADCGCCPVELNASPAAAARCRHGALSAPPHVHGPTLSRLHIGEAGRPAGRAAHMVRGPRVRSVPGRRERRPTDPVWSPKTARGSTV